MKDLVNEIYNLRFEICDLLEIHSTEDWDDCLYLSPEVKTEKILELVISKIRKTEVKNGN